MKFFFFYKKNIFFSKKNKKENFKDTPSNINLKHEQVELNSTNKTTTQTQWLTAMVYWPCLLPRQGYCCV
jgi:hypothetical protein